MPERVLTLNVGFLWQIAFGIFHNLREVFDELWVHLVEPFGHSSQLPDLICDIFEDFLRNLVVFEEVKSLHCVVALKTDSDSAIDRFLHDHCRVL